MASDITFVPTAAGFLFLAVVLDAWSRRIVGWAFSHDLKTRLVLDALDMAIASRKPEEVIHHSDKGSQYTSWAFGHRCRGEAMPNGIRPSTGTAGDALDNAMCESFFATLECELIDRHRFTTKAEAQIAVFRFIEGVSQPLAPPFVHRLHVTHGVRSRASAQPCPGGYGQTRNLSVKAGQLQTLMPVLSISRCSGPDEPR